MYLYCFIWDYSNLSLFAALDKFLFNSEQSMPRQIQICMLDFTYCNSCDRRLNKNTNNQAS